MTWFDARRSSSLQGIVKGSFAGIQRFNAVLPGHEAFRSTNEGGQNRAAFEGQ